jgi:hypothetical protein
LAFQPTKGTSNEETDRIDARRICRIATFMPLTIAQPCRREEAGRRCQEQLHEEMHGRCRCPPENAACAATAKEKKLAGAAKNSFMKKCTWLTPPPNNSRWRL